MPILLVLTPFCTDFCRTSEAVILLSLLQGSAQLLMDILSTAEDSSQAMTEQSVIDCIKALEDMNIHTISPLLARQVLKQRIYFD